MAEARLEMTVGELRFAAEGSEKWVDEKFSEFLTRAKELARPSTSSDKVDSAPQQKKADASVVSSSLATFLRENNVGNTQVNRFLATAIWLQRNGAELLKTTDVAKALVDARQQPLGNPADVLNQNVTKGFCVKSGDGFYVTPEGDQFFNKK